MTSTPSIAWLFRLFSLLLALAAPLPAWASRTVMELPDHFPLRLEGRLEYVEDPSGAMTLDQVRALPGRRYTELTPDNFAKGFTSSAYWVRFTLTNPEPRSVVWVLQHRLPFTDYVEAWILTGQVRMHEVAGDRTMMAERQLPTHMPSFKFTSAPGESTEVYVRLSNMNNAEMQLVFRLDTLASFVSNMARSENRLGILYGVPLALAFSSLVGAAVARDRRFSTYGLYALATIVTWIGFNGHFARFLPFDDPDLFNNLLHIVMLVQIIFLHLFAREFLQTRTRMPRFDRIFVAMIAAACIGIALRLAGVFTLVSQLTLALMALTSITTLAAWHGWRIGMEHARWFFFAQLCSTVPVAIGLIGIRLGLYAYDGFVNYQGIYFAELLLLAVAQHDHVRRTQDRQRKLEREHERALAERNAFLEAEMINRTNALSAMERRAAFISQVGAVTQRVAGGEFSARLALPEDTALQPLAISVNAMAESLARLEGARRHWMAEISHELRTPLTGLVGEIEAMLDGVRPLDMEHVESLYRTCSRLTRLVDDLHELAMSYLRPLRCQFAPVDYRQLLTDLSPYFAGEARKKGLELAVVCDAPQTTVQWDSARINQLLINLLSNSVAYTDAPGRVELRATPLAGCLRIEIEDSAPGLSREELAQVFEPLFRAEAARSRRSSGSGLGMKICRAIVDAHHGSIGVTGSALGGVLVRIELPYIPQEHAP